MLSEEVKRYRELSGDNNPNTPISRIGGYLDGYEKAMEQESMRDATPEELKSVNDYIKSISKPTGVKFDFDQEPRDDVPDINNGNIYECQCGYGWDKSKVVRHHFCPNCGAKVAEGNKE